MEIRQCGTSGLRLSSLGLGTLTWGRDTEEAQAHEMLSRFLEAGGTFIEGSLLDGDGRAVDVLASVLGQLGRRQLVLAWRGAVRPLHEGQWTHSGARGDMLRSLDDALLRLDVDDVDLWIAQYDHSVPLEETLGALEAAHRSGRAHYLGLADFPLWDAARAITLLQEIHGVPIAAIQVPFSLLTARASQEFLQRARSEGIGLIARSPLAGGVVTGKYRHQTPPDSRAASAHMRTSVESFLQPAGRALVEGLARAAQGLDRTALDLGLAWVEGAPAVTSALTGPRTPRQLDQILEGGAPLPEPIRGVLNEIAGVTF